MNIIIVGAGSIGSFITSKLADAGHDIVVIEKDMDILNDLLAENDVRGVVGDGRDPETLKEAEVDRCDVFMAMTLSDDCNIISCIMAKRLGAFYTIARMRSPRYMNNRDFMKNTMGVDRTVNPEFITARQIQRELQYPKAMGVHSFLRGHVDSIHFEVASNSMLKGRTIQESNSKGYLKNILVGLVESEGKTLTPNGDYVVKEGDIIYAFAETQDLKDFYNREFKEAKKIKNVLIIGGGRIGFYLTQLLLENKFSVTVIEKDKDRAIYLQETYPKAVIITADGTNPEILEEEGLNNFDAVMALTESDQVNIIISLMLKKFHIGKSIAKVDKTQLLELTGILDEKETISPKFAVSDFIERVVFSKEGANGGSIENIYDIESKLTQAIDFKVLDNSKFDNKEIRDLNIDAGTLIAYIFHTNEGTTETASGNSKIHQGDRVLVITENIDKYSEINDIVE